MIAPDDEEEVDAQAGSLEGPLFQILLLLHPQRFESYCARMGLPRTGADVGYGVHCLLTGILGKKAPATFDTGPARLGSGIEVSAYVGMPLTALEAQARRFADPPAFAAIEWDACMDKPLPEQWLPSEEVGFHVRACPVQRTSAGRPGMRVGSEQDVFEAFLAEEKEQGRPPNPRGPKRED